MPWNPDRYRQFQKEREVPFEDLVRCISIRPGMRVVDLGCGTGELTARLAAMLPGSDVLGIDSSTEMLEQAGKLERPGLHFAVGTIEEIEGSWDVVFSHAAIQWVDDHEELIPRLFSLVRAGGQLAIQVPSNHDHPSHRIIREIAALDPFREALEGWNRQFPVLTIAGYANLLYTHGGEDIVVFEKLYPHVLPDAESVADWMAGTALVPYMERLPVAMQEAFMQRYREKLEQYWPSGPVFYGFQRTLFSATRLV